MNSITNIKTQDSVLNNTKNILSDCVLISKAYVKKQEEFKTLYDMVKYLTKNLLRNNSTNIHNLQLAFNTINDYRGKLLQYIKIIDQKEETIKNLTLEIQDITETIQTTTTTKYPHNASKDGENQKLKATILSLKQKIQELTTFTNNPEQFKDKEYIYKAIKDQAEMMREVQANINNVKTNNEMVNKTVEEMNKLVKTPINTLVPTQKSVS